MTPTDISEGDGVNLFDAKSRTTLYARDRPYHLYIVIQRIEALLNLDRKLDRALDVACGWMGRNAISRLRAFIRRGACPSPKRRACPPER